MVNKIISNTIFLLPMLAYGATEKAQQPNILWLTYEDTSPDFIGCYGNRYAHTPNIDALARDGVTFNAAFSTGAVSSPSRFCLITGVKAFTAGNGNHRSKYPIETEWEGFPYYLRCAGYYTSNNSKTDYNLDNEKAFVKRAWDECSNSASWSKRKKGQPFFAVYNSAASHQSRTMTQSYEEYQQLVLDKLLPEETIAWGTLPMPPIYRDSPEMQKNISRAYNSISLTDKEFGEWLLKLEKDGLRDSTIVFCFSDHGEALPRGKCAPLSMGYRVAFSIWIPPMYQHLSPYGSGVFTDEVVSFEDFAPTVLALAGVDIPKHMQGVPFVGGSKKEERRYAFSGVDRTDENTELSRSVTDGRYIYTRCFIPYQPLVRWHVYHDVSDIQKQIRSDFEQGKLNKTQAALLEPREVEFLYDLKKDPWEVQNLACDVRYHGILSRLKAVLLSNIIAERDPHFVPEQVALSYAKNGIAPWSMKNDTLLYPVERVIETAMLVGMGKEVVEKQVLLLQDTNDIVTYWAAIGLYSQQECSQHYYATLFRHFENLKNSSLTKLYLAAALLKNFDDKRAMNYLFESVAYPDQEVQRLSFQLINMFPLSIQREALPYVEKYVTQTPQKSIPHLVKEWIKIYKYRNCGDVLKL